MARQTRPSGPISNPFRTAARETITFHGAPQSGSAESAPTAPHATPALDKAESKSAKKAGPARFWRNRGGRTALLLAFALSIGAHFWVTPFGLLPEGGLKTKDVDEELTIPIELLGEEPPPEEKPEPPPPAMTPEEDPNGIKSKPDAGPKPKPKPDASAPDAEALAQDAAAGPTARDGGDLAGDGGAPAETAASDGGLEGGLLANGDSGAPAGASGPRDPGAIIGLPGLISAGTINVTLVVNIAVIRTNPVGARMGPLLFGIPQWNDFMKGSHTTIDPIKDTDWILIYGPSLIHTDRDAVIVHYSATDALVDQAVDQISKSYDHGGPFDAGVPGVKASLGHADNAERVFLRGQPHVLTIVPKDKATDFARLMKRATLNPRIRQGEAMRLIVKDPWKQISIPGLKFSNALKELRIWIVPRSDGGADVNVEGDCTDEAAASDAADALTDLIKRNNSFLVRTATRGLLNGAKVEANGTQITSKLTATPDQLEGILQSVGAFLGVQVQPPAGGGR